jgi:pimeloyl-ACP methyl ester carboxylesterase
MFDADQIETRYAKSGDLNIAYQLFGKGDVNVVLVPGWASNVEHIWTFPEFAEFCEKLGRFACVVLLDRRGTGLSDPVLAPPTLEERMDDVRAVMDGAGWSSAAIWGISEGGPMAILFAATYPSARPRCCCTARSRESRAPTTTRSVCRPRCSPAGSAPSNRSGARARCRRPWRRTAPTTRASFG